MLNTSVRNSRRAFSPIAVSLKRPMSQLLIGGLQQSVRGIAKRSQGAIRENRGIKNQTILARIVGRERASYVGLARTFEAKRAALQLLVVAVVVQDGETALVRINAGNLPAIQRPSFKALEFWNGQLPDVVENEAMARIVERGRVGRVKVRWVEDLLETRGIVQRFAVGVGSLKLQAVRETLLEERLQGIVIGMCRVIFGKNAVEDFGAIGRATAGQRIGVGWIAIRRSVRTQANQIN